MAQAGANPRAREQMYPHPVEVAGGGSLGMLSTNAYVKASVSIQQLLIVSGHIVMTSNDIAGLLHMLSFKLYRALP